MRERQIYHQSNRWRRQSPSRFVKSITEVRKRLGVYVVLQFCDFPTRAVNENVCCDVFADITPHWSVGWPRLRQSQPSAQPIVVEDGVSTRMHGVGVAKRTISLRLVGFTYLSRGSSIYLILSFIFILNDLFLRFLPLLDFHVGLQFFASCDYFNLFYSSSRSVEKRTDLIDIASVFFFCESLFDFCLFLFIVIASFCGRIEVTSV